MQVLFVVACLNMIQKRKLQIAKVTCRPCRIVALGNQRNCVKNAPVSSTRGVSTQLGAEGLKWVRGNNRIGGGLLLGATEEG